MFVISSIKSGSMPKFSDIMKQFSICILLYIENNWNGWAFFHLIRSFFVSFPLSLHLTHYPSRNS